MSRILSLGCLLGQVDSSGLEYQVPQGVENMEKCGDVIVSDSR